MIPIQRSWRLALASAAAAALLASCGGGTEESSSNASAPLAAPAVTAAPARTTVGDPQAAASRAIQRSQKYIVRLAEPSAARYDGSINGYAATQVEQGHKLNSRSAKVAAYRGYLKSRQEYIAAGAGVTNRTYSYSLTFNGFAADLTPEQVEKLSATKGVLSVEKDKLLHLDTASTHKFLGLKGPRSIWSRGFKGDDIIIGMIDSGIWPESESFADREDKMGVPTNKATGKVVYSAPPPWWNGSCLASGEEWSAATHCNNKLIGAHYYNSGWGGDAGINSLFPYEYNSPRDWGGHGTHTASTAGGNFGVTITGAAAAFGTINGMAPRARVAMYKVCWGPEGVGGCYGTDSVAAIEQAIEDGVDVINFSISGATTSSQDAVELAFLDAAYAGVFVAASAGNSGPDAGTVAHPSPWITTVAAGTHNRTAGGTVTLGNNRKFSGISTAGAAVASRPFIDAAAAAMPGQEYAAGRCFLPSDNGGTKALDPAKVRGKIVLCDRGTNARVNKSAAVAEAGGVGVVLVNTSPNSLNADFHSVPTVHLADTARATLKAYAATAGATASISKSSLDFEASAPFTAGFSSRGPTPAAGGNILKPDLIAPGNDIVAAVAPPGNSGRSFDIYSGTSMSSPHVAGVAALLREAHPNWSPMMIKSALMTTAYDVLDGSNTSPPVIFSQGAGTINPNAALDPGLVFNSTLGDWARYLCYEDSYWCDAFGVHLTPTQPSDFNMASIAINRLAGAQTVKRKVTNVGKAVATYSASFVGSGVTVTMSPSSFSINPGEAKSITFTLTKTSAPLNAYVGGQLTLTDGSHKVRLPVVVKPVSLGAPAEASIASGGGTYPVKVGFDGSLTVTPRGLVAPLIASNALTTGTCYDIPVTIAANTSYARFSTFDSDYAGGSDVDLYLFNTTPPGSCGTTGAIKGSGGATAQEEINYANPPAGNYTVRVIGYLLSGSVTSKAYAWQLGTADAGNMTVSAPGSVTSGTTATVTVTPNGGLAAGKWLGSVVYGGSAASVPNPTIIRVDK